MEQVIAIVVFGLMAVVAFFGFTQAQRDAANINPGDSYGMRRPRKFPSNRSWTL